MTYGGSRRADLTERLARGQRLLKSRLGRPETVLALMRAAHESLDASVIGEQVVLLATDWFKTPACGVYAADLEGQVAPLAARGLGGTLAPGLGGDVVVVECHCRHLSALSCVAAASALCSVARPAPEPNAYPRGRR